jgi:hypothetical protein
MLPLSLVKLIKFPLLLYVSLHLHYVCNKMRDSLLLVFGGRPPPQKKREPVISFIVINDVFSDYAITWVLGMNIIQLVSS